MIGAGREGERERVCVCEKVMSIACFLELGNGVGHRCSLLFFSFSLHLAPLVRNAFDPLQPAVSILREELCGRRGYGVEERGFQDDLVGECRAQAVDGAAAVPAEVALQTVDAISGGRKPKGRPASYQACGAGEGVRVMIDLQTGLRVFDTDLSLIQDVADRVRLLQSVEWPRPASLSEHIRAAPVRRQLELRIKKSQSPLICWAQAPYQ